VNDGKIRLKVVQQGRGFVTCEVIVGGEISDRKGVNLPDVILPVSALSEKDRGDLEFVCELGVDWLACGRRIFGYREICQHSSQRS